MNTTGRPRGRYDLSREYVRARYNVLTVELMIDAGSRRPSETIYSQRFGVDPRTWRRYRDAYDIPRGSTGIDLP